MANCAVCTFEINDANPRLRSSYQGREFQFCCPICKGAFDAVPDRFAERAGAAAGAAGARAAFAPRP